MKSIAEYALTNKALIKLFIAVLVIGIKPRSWAFPLSTSESCFLFMFLLFSL